MYLRYYSTNETDNGEAKEETSAATADDSSKEKKKRDENNDVKTKVDAKTSEGVWAFLYLPAGT